MDCQDEAIYLYIIFICCKPCKVERFDNVNDSGEEIKILISYSLLNFGMNFAFKILSLQILDLAFQLCF